MKKKKSIIAVLLAVLLLGGVSLTLNEYHHRISDSQKPRIFEIEDTASRGAYLQGFEEVRYYMIQDCPNNEDDLKELVKDFCNQNQFSDVINSSNNTYGIEIFFMKPSWKLPVCWNIEWAKTHFHGDRDNPMTNFLNTNRVAYVSYTYNGYSGYREDMSFHSENL
ncbi:MAG: hypothetical protein U0L18_02125 [Acutalibacteraceae bacterium]|nr:hypothetical protein [Acutalibacteraceae bacterium]